MTLCTIVVASYVTVMYGLTYGYARSVAWTVSFISTFFQDTAILEPVKIVTIAVFVTFIVGARARPNVPDAQTLNRGSFGDYFITNVIIKVCICTVVNNLTHELTYISSIVVVIMISKKQ